MATAFPSSLNTYVPSHEASGGLTVGYSRNPKKFRLNKYMKLVPVKKGQGYYLQITAEEAARVINTNLADFVWHDGAEAPMGNDNLESFQYVKFLTTRYAFAFNLGAKTIDMADWPVLSVHAGFAAQKSMTARTVGAQTGLTTGANWGSSTATATAVTTGGGRFDVSGPTDKFIRKAFNQIAENILQNTIGVVQRDELVAVFNPHDARLMGESEELRDYLKQGGAVSVAEVKGTDKAQNGTWGLPSDLWGFRLEVEDAIRTTTRKGITTARTYCLPTGNGEFMARPGGLLGMEGIPEFSSAQLFVYEEMTVETMNDSNNRRTVGRVVDDWAFSLVSSASGWLLTSISTT